MACTDYILSSWPDARRSRSTTSSSFALQEALGTHGLKDTVDAAFHEAIRRSLRTRLAERIERGTGVDRSADLLAETRPAR